MDGVLFDFETGFLERWNALWPKLRIEHEERENWQLEYDVIAKYGLPFIAEVLGSNLVAAEHDPLKPDNAEETLIRRAVRRQVLNIINASGFFSQLEPVWENVEQVKRIMDAGKYEVSIMTALPDENHAGFAEKTAALKRAFGPEYFGRLYSRIYIAGRKTYKGDMYFDVIFEDNTDLKPRLRIASGLHMIVETDHNKNFQPGIFQKFVPKGADWMKAAGL